MLNESFTSITSEQCSIDSLDLSYVLPGLAAMGLPWKLRTERASHRNNVVELSKYLKQQHSQHVMIFNLAPYQQSQYNYNTFDNQVIECDFDHFCPNLDDLFNILFSKCILPI